MPVTVGSVLDSAAALVNDPNKVTYTYAKMLPYFRIVYELAQNRLTLMSHQTLAEVSSVITVIAGETKILIVDGTATTDGLTYPIAAFERSVGGNEDSWQEMDRKSWEELRTAESTIGTWAWRKGVITINPATVNREVKLRYSKVFLAITDENSNIEHPNFASFLRYATAGHIAAFVMKDIQRATMLNDLAEIAMNIATSTAVKSMQYQPRNRKSYFFRR